MTIDPDPPTLDGMPSTSSAWSTSSTTRPPLLDAAERTIAALRAADLLQPRHELLLQTIRELAAALAVAVRAGKASSVALCARELREAYALLPEPPETPGDGVRWAAFLAAVEAAANGEPVGGGMVESAGRGAAVRNPARPDPTD